MPSYSTPFKIHIYYTSQIGEKWDSLGTHSAQVYVASQLNISEQCSTIMGVLRTWNIWHSFLVRI